MRGARLGVGGGVSTWSLQKVFVIVHSNLYNSFFSQANNENHRLTAVFSPNICFTLLPGCRLMDAKR